MNNEVALREPMELSVDDVRGQVEKIQGLMKGLMQKDEHYGVIPGTKKPSLYKAGAEKLGFTFRLVPEFQVTRNDLKGDHREYEVRCTLRHQPTEKLAGEGVGNCSTMESKYRYRNVWNNGTKTKVENTDIADTYNTVLKMAKKRAYVDAMITATAASDIFTQDVEDLPPEPKKEKKNDQRRKLIDDIAAEIKKHNFPEGELSYYRKQIKHTDTKALPGLLDEIKKAGKALEKKGVNDAFDGTVEDADYEPQKEELPLDDEADNKVQVGTQPKGDIF